MWMSGQIIHSLLAAAPNGETLQFWEWNLPTSIWGWLGACVGLAALLVYITIVSLRDSSRLPTPVRALLLGLRWLVLAGIVLIALNPHLRTQKTTYRPSRVAVLVDTSSSMNFPAADAAATATPTSTPPADEDETTSRTSAVLNLLTQSTFFDQLRNQHQLRVYGFDSQLNGPLTVLDVSTGDKTDNNPANSEAGTNQAKPVDDAAPDWPTLIDATGSETRLGESLRQLIRQESTHGTLAGVVLLSDGVSNSGISADLATKLARENDIRLLTVGVGSRKRPVNLKIAGSLQAPSHAHIGDPYDIGVLLQGSGLEEGTEIEAELWSKSADDPEAKPIRIDSQSAKLLEDGIPTEVRFHREPAIEGRVEFQVKARTVIPVREINVDDNQRKKTIEIVSRKTKVLLLAGGPMREYRFVRNMLFRHTGVSIDVWLQSIETAAVETISQESDRLLVGFPETREQLFEYDVMVAFDPDWSRVSKEQQQLMAEWVSDHSGGIVFVAGDVFTPEMAKDNEQFSTLHDLLPVFLQKNVLTYQLESRSDQVMPIDFTREGREIRFLQLDENPSKDKLGWKEFPGIFRCYPSAGAKAGATVYAHFSDPRSQTEYGFPILMASQFLGQGKTFYLGSGEMWRLRLLGETVYDRFWTQLIREVGQARLKRGNSRGLLIPERNEYLLGETIHIRARVLNPQFEPLDEESVPLSVFDPSGRPVLPAVSLMRDSNRPGEYFGDLRANQLGTYRFELPIPGSNKTELAELSVSQPLLEEAKPEQNVPLLTRLANSTSGQYVDIHALSDEFQMAEVSADNITASPTAADGSDATSTVERPLDLKTLLPNRRKAIVVNDPLDALWDRNWVLYLLVGLLSGEWLIRKLFKLA